jgi:hypothetical protein
MLLVPITSIIGTKSIAENEKMPLGHNRFLGPFIFGKRRK